MVDGGQVFAVSYFNSFIYTKSKHKFGINLW